MYQARARNSPTPKIDLSRKFGIEAPSEGTRLRSVRNSGDSSRNINGEWVNGPSLDIEERRCEACVPAKDVDLHGARQFAPISEEISCADHEAARAAET